MKNCMENYMKMSMKLYENYVKLYENCMKLYKNVFLKCRYLLLVYYA